MSSKKKIGNWILLVEDDPNDEELTLRSFEKHRLANDVVVVRDGEEALECLFGRGRYKKRPFSDLPRLILLDLKLPKMDGLEVLKEIRGNVETRFLPVVILTSSEQESDLIASYENGANGFVKKPIDYEGFSEMVERLGLYWMLVNRPPGKMSV